MVALRHISGLLAVCCLVLSCGDEEERLCTLVGCGDVHEMTVEVASDAPSSELTIEACFNDECGSAPPASGLHSARIDLVGGKLWASARFSTVDEERVLLVSWGTNGSITEKEGDRYAVRVTTSDATTVGESVEIAERYSRSYPNGEGCGPGCLHVDSVRRVP